MVGILEERARFRSEVQSPMLRGGYMNTQSVRAFFVQFHSAPMNVREATARSDRLMRAIVTAAYECDKDESLVEPFDLICECGRRAIAPAPSTGPWTAAGHKHDPFGEFYAIRSKSLIANANLFLARGRFSLRGSMAKDFEFLLKYIS